jgi:hypothetical protein
MDNSFHKDLVGCMNAIPSIHKDSLNPHFRAKFASLDAIMTKVKPILDKHNFCLLPDVWSLDGSMAMRMKLMHTSGEFIESSVFRMAITNPSNQGQGSTQSYLRRYSICSFLNITTDDESDDDAELAEAPVRKASPKKKDIGDDLVPF